MTISLRTKLFFLATLSIALAVVPIIMLSYHELHSVSLKREQETFGNVVVLVEDNISARYLGLLTNSILSVLQRKNQLRHTSLLARSTWRDLATEPEYARLRVLGGWGAPLRDFGSYFDVYNASGASLLRTPLMMRLTGDPRRADVKGRPLSSLLRADQLPADGEFAVFSLEAAPGQNASAETLLVFFLPAPEDAVVFVLGVTLSDLEREAKYLEGQIIAGTQEKFDTLDLYESGFLVLLSGDSRVLAHTGNAAGRDASALPAQGLSRAKERGFVEYEFVPGDGASNTVYRIAYFKALDWYIVAAVPRAEMEASTNAVVRGMVALAVGSGLFCVLGTLLVAARLVKPLRTLTSQARSLAACDFSAEGGDFVSRDEQSPLLALARELPVGRRDEVGTLATAFVDMGQALDANIRQLMETTTIKERMQGELQAAREIQMGILPASGTLPHPGCAIATLLEPAKEVGGDLYDFFLAPDGRQVVVIGDVSDKGVPAALFMSMTVTLVRYALGGFVSPDEAMERINERLSQNNPGCMFVTLFIGVFDPETGVFEYANGGHCPPLVIDRKTRVARVLEETSGPLVGAMPGMFYTLRRTRLGPDELCLLYTDGVTEAMNEARELFGEQQTLAVAADHATSPGKVVDALRAAVAAHRGSAVQSDDITLLCFCHDAS